MEFRILGPLEVIDDGHRVEITAPKQRALLAVLLLSANRVVSGDRLLGELWGEDPPGAGLNTLKYHVSKLRDALQPDRVAGEEGNLVTRPPGYALLVGSDDCDASRFERLVGQARGLLTSDPARASDTLREAIDLWRGPALEGFQGEPFSAIEGPRLEELRLAALEDRLEADLAVGRHADLIGELERLTAEYPFRERLWAQLMVALYRSDRQVEALRAYQQLRTLLGEQLGLEPSAELAALEERILFQDAALKNPGAVQPPGGRLRGYDFQEKLGEGVAGVVWRAVQPAIGRDVAVKVIKPKLSNQPDFVRRFEREARLIASLEHPHIVPVFDFWRGPDGAYLVMRLMGGGGLDRLPPAPWEVARVVRAVEQIASGLTYAHRRGVQHGDLHPGNVLLDGDGNAYLADFGLAASLDIGSTPPGGYSSPERQRGERASNVTDVFGLGALVFRLLTGLDPPGGRLPRVHDLHPDLPVEVDRVLEWATAPEPGSRFGDVDEFVGKLRAAVARPTAVKPAMQPRNPYKGLRAFGEADSPDFFGRESEVDELVAVVAANRLVGVVGPSGSGKSSLVRAGLVPAVHTGCIPGSETWLTADLYPGAEPFAELTDALLRVAVEHPPQLSERLADPAAVASAVCDALPSGSALLLVVDQFEELFTLCVDADVRRRFMDALVALATDPEGRVRIVVTVRADFYGLPLEYQPFGDLLRSAVVSITPPAPEEITKAVTQPAEQVGVVVDADLAALIARDVSDEPGGLPLMEYALTQLFEEASDRLTTEAYRRAGGVAGALGRWPEHLFTDFDEQARAATRQIFLRLVNVGEGDQLTRRRVPFPELFGLGIAPPLVDRVLEAFGAARLLTFDRDPQTRTPTVEVAHEALLREWGRLRGWIEDEREALVLARRLRVAMSEWQQSDSNDDYLLTGDRLAPFRDWSPSGSLTEDEHDFLDRSTTADHTARAARRRRRRFTVASLSTAAVVATILAVFALNQGARADREATRAVTLAEQQTEARQEADAQAALAEDAATEAKQAEALAKARELAASAIGVGETDPQLAMLLALQAVDTQPQGVDTPVELRNALRRALHDSHLARVIPVLPQVPGEASVSSALVFAPDGSAVGVMSRSADGTSVRRVYSPDTWQILWETDDPAVSILALSPGGDRMLLQQSDPAGPPAATLETVSLPDGTIQSTIPVTCGVSMAAWSSDGTLVAVVEAEPFVEPGKEPDCSRAEAEDVRVYSAAGGGVVHEFPTAGFPLRLEFIDGPDGELLVYTDNYAGPRKTVILDTDGFEPVASFNYSTGAVSPDGSRFLGIDLWGNRQVLVDVETGAVQDLLDGLEAQVAITQSEYFSPDGHRLAIANESSRIPVWDVETGAMVAMVHAGKEADVGFVDADTMVATSGDGNLTIWDLSLEGTGELNSRNVGLPFMEQGIQTGDSVGATWSWTPERAAGFLFDPATGVLGKELPGPVGGYPAPAGDAGVLYVTGDGFGSGTLRWWSAETGEVVDIEGCWSSSLGWPEQPEPCPDGTIPASPAGTSSSTDGTEAGFLAEDGSFRVWKDGSEPVEQVDLALEEPGLSSMLMGFSDEWIVVRMHVVPPDGYWEYDVFDRQTGELETTLQLPYVWIRFDRSGAVGIGRGFDKTLAVISTNDWTWKVLTTDLGDGVGRGVALSPTGDRVAVGVMDGFVRVFSVDDGTLLDVIPIERAVALQWLDDTHIAAGTESGLWTVLTLDINELEGLAREKLTRDFTPNECEIYHIESCTAAAGT